MLRRTFCLAAATALLGVAGCGGGPDGLVKDMIAEMNAVADAMEKGESEDKIKELMSKMEATTKKLEDLKLSEDEKKKLQERHKDALAKAGERMASAMMKKMVGGLGLPPGMPGFTVPAMPDNNKATNPIPTDPGK